MFRLIEKQFSLILSDTVCSYFKEHDFLTENNKKIFNDLQSKPGQIIIINIQYSNFTEAFFNLLLLAKNIVIFSDDEYFTDNKQLKEKHNSTCRDLIQHIKPKFAIIIHDGKKEEYIKAANYQLIDLIEDTDLHKNIATLTHHCHHYNNNKYKLQMSV